MSLCTLLLFVEFSSLHSGGVVGGGERARRLGSGRTGGEAGVDGGVKMVLVLPYPPPPPTHPPPRPLAPPMAPSRAPSLRVLQGRQVRGRAGGGRATDAAGWRSGGHGAVGGWEHGEGRYVIEDKKKNDAKQPAKNVT